MNYFIYNGIKSSELGIRIEKKNVFSAPSLDREFITIPGRDGDLIDENIRLQNVVVSYTCFVASKSLDELNHRLRSIKEWLYQNTNR